MKIAIIGMGTMGTAIQQRLSGGEFEVVGLGREDDKSAVSTAEVIILAIKPQSFGEVAEQLEAHIDTQLIISIMAGVPTSTLTACLDTKRIVRTMPNLALATGQSLTTWYTKLDDKDAKIAKRLIGRLGSSLRLASEEQFHACTAIGGSGMAYYFELAHLVEEVGVRLGFSASDARMMSVQTLRGAASFLEGDTPPEDLVQRIASKGGTTEAALTVFRERGFEQMVTDAIQAACDRSRELGKR